MADAAVGLPVGCGPRAPTSRYAEDIFDGGHTSVYGSFYCAASGRWGFSCCRLLGDPRAPHLVPNESALGEGSGYNAKCSVPPAVIRSADCLDSGRAIPAAREATSQEFVYLAILALLKVWRELEASGTLAAPGPLRDFGRVGLRAQTEQDLGVLLRALQEKRLALLCSGPRSGRPAGADDDGLIENLRQALACCQSRDYRAALQAYMGAALGSSKWQIGGVSMYNQKKVRTVGHQDAHLLADEGMKRAMNALRRLLSFAEAREPPDEPSKGTA